MPVPAALTVVLHQVQSPDNLGAVARVMANFGVERLVLSDPQTTDLQAARKLAVHSGHVLEQARVVSSLKEALGEVTYACGSTFRAEVGLRRALTPEEAASRMATKARGGPVALVLGGERRGLSDEELDACDDFLTIPTDAKQPSLNLAQATAVALYVLTRTEKPATGEGSELARLATVNALEAAMRQALEPTGFLNRQAPQAVLPELLRSLRRGELTQREAEMWTAAFKQLARLTTRKP